MKIFKFFLKTLYLNYKHSFSMLSKFVQQERRRKTLVLLYSFSYYTRGIIWLFKRLATFRLSISEKLQKFRSQFRARRNSWINKLTFFIHFKNKTLDLYNNNKVIRTKIKIYTIMRELHFSFNLPVQTHLRFSQPSETISVMRIFN